MTTYLKFPVLEMLVAAVLIMQGCSKDDVEISTGTYRLTTADGDVVYLKSVNDVTFSYDSEGLLTRFGESGEYYVTVNYNPLVFTIEGEEMTAGLNGSGYISSMAGTYQDEDFYESFKTTFSYNGSGQLSKMSITDSGWEEDKENTWSDMMAVTFEYSSGSIKSVTSVYTGKDEDGTYTFNTKDTFSYDDDPVGNAASQHVCCLFGTDDLGDSFYSLLAMVGLLGKSSANLPSGSEQTWSDSDGDEDSYSFTFTYTFNGDGTVAAEKWKSGSYSRTYKYTYYDSSEILTSDTKADGNETGICSGDTVRRPYMSGLRRVRERHGMR